VFVLPKLRILRSDKKRKWESNNKWAVIRFGPTNKMQFCFRSVGLIWNTGSNVHHEVHNRWSILDFGFVECKLRLYFVFGESLSVTNRRSASCTSLTDVPVGLSVLLYSSLLVSIFNLHFFLGLVELMLSIYTMYWYARYAYKWDTAPLHC
jgi:hypothetical protein